MCYRNRPNTLASDSGKNGENRQKSRPEKRPEKRGPVQAGECIVAPENARRR